MNHSAGDVLIFPSKKERGYQVRKSGIHGDGIIVHYNGTICVIKWKGYSDNPGSRYSGLKEYYPSTTEVLMAGEKDSSGNIRWKSLGDWQTRAPKE